MDPREVEWSDLVVGGGGVGGGVGVGVGGGVCSSLRKKDAGVIIIRDSSSVDENGAFWLTMVGTGDSV